MPSTPSAKKRPSSNAECVADVGDNPKRANPTKVEAEWIPPRCSAGSGFFLQLDTDDLDESDGERELFVEDLVKTATVQLCARYKKNWSFSDAQKVFPGLSERAYNNDSAVVAKLVVDYLNGRWFSKAIRTGDWSNVSVALDAKSQCLYDTMNACTTIDTAENPGKNFCRSFDWKPTAASSFVHLDILEFLDRQFEKVEGLGARLVNEGLRLIDEEKNMGTAGPVYVKPFPMQWNRAEGEGPPESGDPFKRKTFTDAQKQKMHKDTLDIIEWWKSLGFRSVEGSVGGGFDEYKYGYLVRGVLE